MTRERSYDDKVLEAFEAVCERHKAEPEGERGASPMEVLEEMQRRKTLSAMDTVLDIADIMKRLLKGPR